MPEIMLVCQITERFSNNPHPSNSGREKLRINRAKAITKDFRIESFSPLFKIRNIDCMNIAISPDLEPDRNTIIRARRTPNILIAIFCLNSKKGRKKAAVAAKALGSPKVPIVRPFSSPPKIIVATKRKTMQIG